MRPAPASLRRAVAAKDAGAPEGKPCARQGDCQAVRVEPGPGGNRIPKIRDSLIPRQRLLASGTSLASERKPGKAVDCRIRTLAVDVQALREPAGFLTHKINFLCDSMPGMITIRQTAIIRIVPVAPVVFLPLTRASLSAA